MLDEIFKALLNSAQSQPIQPQAEPSSNQQNMFTDLLQGALQGQQPPTQANEPENLAGMAGFLGGLFGGSGSASSHGNPLVASIANMLAEKLNISPAIAATVVNFALSALLARGKRQPGDQRDMAESAFDLDDIIDGDFAFSSGMAEQVSRQTGLSEQDAAQSLQEAMILLNKQAAMPPQNTSEDIPPVFNDDLFDGLMDSLDLD